MPELSASTVITLAQAVVFSVVALCAVAFAITWPEAAFVLTIALSALSFLAGTGFRGYLALLGGEIVTRPGSAVADDDLPIYTILVPLYHEANVLPRLARELAQLDYPDMLAQAPQTRTY